MALILHFSPMCCDTDSNWLHCRTKTHFSRDVFAVALVRWARNMNNSTWDLIFQRAFERGWLKSTLQPSSYLHFTSETFAAHLWCFSNQKAFSLSGSRLKLRGVDVLVVTFLHDRCTLTGDFIKIWLLICCMMVLCIISFVPFLHSSHWPLFKQWRPLKKIPASSENS